MKYQKLEAVQVLKENEEFIEGEEFIKRAQELTKGTMNDEAFDFYSKKENWHLLPEVDYLFFADTVFRSSSGYRYVRYLCRGGAEWNRFYYWFGSRFIRNYRVAVLASPSNSESLEPSDSLTFESKILDLLTNIKDLLEEQKVKEKKICICGTSSLNTVGCSKHD